jgi:hypothetical protein
MQEDQAEIQARLLRDPALQREWLRQDKVMFGGLIAGCVALAQPFLTAGPLDLTGSVAVVSFAVAIPLLAALFMVNEQENFRHRRAEVWLIPFAKAAGQAFAVLGIAAAFWHVLWIAGVAIIVSALVGLTVHTVGFTRVEGLDDVGRRPR